MNTSTARETTAGPGQRARRAALGVALAFALGIAASPGALGQEAYGAESIRAMAVTAVERQLPDAEIARGANRTEVEAGSIDTRLRFAACDGTPRGEVDLSRGAGRYNVRLSCPAPAPWSIYVPVEVRVYRDTVVASRSMARGELIGPNDVRLEERNVLAPGANGLTSLDDAIGLELRRPVPINGMVSDSAVIAPLLVRRGDRLQVTAHAGGITVGATAEALRDGRRGDRIPARNVQSKRMLEVIVTGPGKGDIAP